MLGLIPHSLFLRCPSLSTVDDRVHKVVSRVRLKNCRSYSEGLLILHSSGLGSKR